MRVEDPVPVANPLDKPFFQLSVEDKKNKLEINFAFLPIERIVTSTVLEQVLFA